MLIAIFGAALTGCRAEEQGRKLGFTPGVYQGEPMPKLEKQQREALRDRGLLQR